jgi:pimeloyl-ACP methyl ester carboxylesterase
MTRSGIRSKGQDSRKPCSSAQSARRLLATIRRIRLPRGLRSMSESDLRDVLPQIDVPTIVLHGEADVRSPKDVAKALCAAIPTPRLIVLPGVGHVSCVEVPERFTAEVKAFLRQVQQRRAPDRYATGDAR